MSQTPQTQVQGAGPEQPAELYSAPGKNLPKNLPGVLVGTITTLSLVLAACSGQPAKLTEAATQIPPKPTETIPATQPPLPVATETPTPYVKGTIAAGISETQTAQATQTAVVGTAFAEGKAAAKATGAANATETAQADAEKAKADAAKAQAAEPTSTRTPKATATPKPKLQAQAPTPVPAPAEATATPPAKAEANQEVEVLAETSLTGSVGIQESGITVEHPINISVKLVTDPSKSFPYVEIGDAFRLILGYELDSATIEAFREKPQLLLNILNGKNALMEQTVKDPGNGNNATKKQIVTARANGFQLDENGQPYIDQDGTRRLRADGFGQDVVVLPEGTIVNQEQTYADTLKKFNNPAKETNNTPEVRIGTSYKVNATYGDQQNGTYEHTVNGVLASLGICITEVGQICASNPNGIWGNANVTVIFPNPEHTLGDGKPEHIFTPASDLFIGENGKLMRIIERGENGNPTKTLPLKLPETYYAVDKVEGSEDEMVNILNKQEWIKKKIKEFRASQTKSMLEDIQRAEEARNRLINVQIANFNGGMYETMANILANAKREQDLQDVQARNFRNAKPVRETLTEQLRKAGKPVLKA